LKVNRHFGGIYPLHLQGSTVIQERRWRGYVPSKYQLTFNRLYGIISQKIELFIINAVGTSKELFTEEFSHVQTCSVK
jgi:hypothetical protein